MLHDLTKHHFIFQKTSSFSRRKRNHCNPGSVYLFLTLQRTIRFWCKMLQRDFTGTIVRQRSTHSFYIMFQKNPMPASVFTGYIHDTVTVYCFLQKLLNEYVKVDFLHVHKVFYFSDGSGVQYKNFKSFTNLLLHKQDFNLKIEWHFFATSHGKNACNGVGGTIKCLVTYASLQRPILNQTETPL